MNKRYKIIITSIIIFVARIIDLYTTDLALINFYEQEQNILVKLLKLNQEMFFLIEILLAIFSVLIYLFSIKNRNKFIIKSANLKNYINYFFYEKTVLEPKDYFSLIPLRSFIILYGSIIPVFVITTSLIFSLNNFWIYLNLKSNFTFKYYILFDKFYFFDLLIFILPPILVVFLFYNKLHDSYLIYNPKN